MNELDQNNWTPPLLGGRAVTSRSFNVADLLNAVKRVNDLADLARGEGWQVDFSAADYLSASVAKTQQGNGQ